MSRFVISLASRLRSVTWCEGLEGRTQKWEPFFFSSSLRIFGRCFSCRSAISRSSTFFVTSLNSSVGNLVSFLTSSKSRFVISLASRLRSVTWCEGLEGRMENWETLFFSSSLRIFGRCFSCGSSISRSSTFFVTSLNSSVGNLVWFLTSSICFVERPRAWNAPRILPMASWKSVSVRRPRRISANSSILNFLRMSTLVLTVVLIPLPIQSESRIA